MAERHDQHAGEASVGPHGAPDDHGDTHGHDDHAHDTETLGPVNVLAWAAAIGGIALGLVVMLAFAQAAT
jgi:hypothetical protein